MKAHLPVRKAILNRRTYEAPAEGRSNKLRLDFNENTSGCSPSVRRALAKLTAKQIAMYPEYQAPTERLARHFGVRPQELLLANGGDDALRVFFDAFVDPRSRILICEPTFPMYRYYAEIYGARIAVTRYTNEMHFPLEAVLLALRKKPREENSFEREVHLVGIARHGDPGAVDFRVVAVHRERRLANQDPATGVDESVEENAQSVISAIREQKFLRTHTEMARQALGRRLVLRIHGDLLGSQLGQSTAHRGRTAGGVFVEVQAQLVRTPFSGRFVGAAI